MRSVTVPRVQIFLVGVGGQGVLAAAQILGMAAHEEGLPVVVGQLHGMSQRGGSVQCTVILGRAESSFLCGGEADVVIAFEPLEALRALPQMGRSTRVVSSRSLIVPFEAVLASAPPPDVDDLIRQLGAVAREVHAVDTRSLMGSVGEARALNVMMLGAAVGLGLVPIGEAAILDAVDARCGPKYRDANRRAFLLGRDALQTRQASAQDERARA
jgi:indolepyruvate ferredoxin oxidoreductase, beta subunit